MLKQYINILRNRNILFLSLAQLTSLFGDWIILVAIYIKVYEFTNSSIALGTTLLFKLLPGIVIGFLAGKLADRFNAKKMMIVCDIARMLAILPLFYISTKEHVSIIYLSVFIVQIFFMSFTIANNKILVVLVKKSELGVANSLHSVIKFTIMTIAMAATGILYPLIGFKGIVATDLITFILSVIFLSWIKYSVIKVGSCLTEKVGSVSMNLKETVICIFSNSALRFVYVSFVVLYLSICVVNVIPTIIPSMKYSLPTAYSSYLFSAIGIASVLGAFFRGTQLFARVAKRYFLLAIFMIAAILLLILNVPFYVAAIALVLFYIPGWALVIQLNTAVLSISDTEHVGRISSLFEINFYLCSMIAAYMYTFVLDVFSFNVAVLLIVFWLILLALLGIVSNKHGLIFDEAKEEQN